MDHDIYISCFSVFYSTFCKFDLKHVESPIKQLELLYPARSKNRKDFVLLFIILRNNFMYRKYSVSNHPQGFSINLL